PGRRSSGRSPPLSGGPPSRCIDQWPEAGSCLPLQSAKGLQNFQAGLPALLRVELGAVHIAVLDRRRQLRAVFGGGSALSFTVKAREGVDEVHVFPLLQAGEDGTSRLVL